MDLEDVGRHWNAFGTHDAMWAILTRPSGVWSTDEFFATGVSDMKEVLERTHAMNFPVRAGRALDFGCGIGRVTQAMARHFGHVYGVDIAPSMIDIARRCNQHPGRCHYEVHRWPDLRRFPDGYFDLVYSVIVLQHMRREYSLAYIREFHRIVKAGGLIVFQLPSERLAQPGSGQTRVNGPLPDPAFRAEILSETAKLTAAAGTHVSIDLRIRNVAPHPWPSVGGPDGSYEIHVGHHWITDGGDGARYDGKRPSKLPKDLAPGESADLEHIVIVPTVPGAYVLEVDLVQEGFAWFGEKGSTTLRILASVTDHGPSDSQRRRQLHPTVPLMEMNGVPKPEVVEWVTHHDGRVLRVFDDCRGGLFWSSFVYFVTR